MSAVGGADEHDDRDADAEPDGTSDSTDDEWCSPCIDRLAGYSALSDDDEDEWPAQPDHTVDMYVRPIHVLFEQTPTDETDVEPGISPGEPEQEDFPDFYFDPVGLRVEPGDVVHFRNLSAGIHTVTAFSPRFNEPPWLDFPQRIPDGSPPFSSPPIGASDHWLYRFPEPGIYDINCLPHYELGMVGRIVVPDEDGNAVADPEDTEELPTAVRTVFDAPEMTVDNILDVETVGWEDLTIEEQIDPESLWEEE